MNLKIFKQVHLASKEISEIYKKENIPKIISYPIWFILLLFSLIVKGFKGGKFGR